MSLLGMNARTIQRALDQYLTEPALYDGDEDWCAIHDEAPGRCVDQDHAHYLNSEAGNCVCGADAIRSGTGHGYQLCGETKREI